jgi:hypothetical protein
MLKQMIVSFYGKKFICTCVLFRKISGRAISLYSTMYIYVHCTDKQHAMSSDELQSALMLTVEFRKCIVLGKFYQLCHLNNKYRYYKQFV